MLTPKDLQLLEELLDRKLDEKFEQKLAPIYNRLDRVEVKVDALDVKVDALDTKVDILTEKLDDHIVETESNFNMLQGYLDQAFRQIGQSNFKLNQLAR
jgi:hypothetical protein